MIKQSKSARATSPSKHIVLWLSVTDRLTEVLGSAGVFLSDVYLVGSQVYTPKRGADFDGVFVVQNDEGLDGLLNIRKLMDQYLAENKVTDRYHFKLFSQQEFSFAASYDGLRIASFQTSHFHYFGRHQLSVLKPNLDLHNFVNSCLIQATYRFFSTLPLTSLGPHMAILNNWLSCNLSLCPLIRYPTRDFRVEYFSTLDPLAHQFFALVDREIDCGFVEALEKYLTTYFHRFRHEEINKRYSYTKRLEAVQRMIARTVER